MTISSPTMLSMPSTCPCRMACITLGLFGRCRPASTCCARSRTAAGLQRPKSPRVMQAIRQGHVDGIDSIVGEEIVIAAVRLSYPPSRRERFGATCVAARDGDHLDIGGSGGPCQHLLVDVRRREHSPM